MRLLLHILYSKCVLRFGKFQEEQHFSLKRCKFGLILATTRSVTYSTVFYLIILSYMRCDGDGGAGVRVSAIIGECGGNIDGEDVKGYGHVYGEQFVLRANGHSNSVRIRGVSVSRVYVVVIWIQTRLFHIKRFSFSSLNLFR